MASNPGDTAVNVASELLAMMVRLEEISLETASFSELVKKARLEKHFTATGDPLAEEQLKKAAEVEKRREEAREKARNHFNYLKESLMNLSHNPNRMDGLISFLLPKKEPGFLPITDDKVPQLLELLKETVVCLNEVSTRDEEEEEEAAKEEMVAKMEEEEKEERRKKQKMDEKNEEDECMKKFDFDLNN